MQGEIKFQLVSNNLPTEIDLTNTKRISKIRRELIKSANWNGSYGGKRGPEHITTTSQVILALSALGDHRDLRRVRRALIWLSSAKIINSEFAPWALAPFNCCGNHPEEVQKTFARADQDATDGVFHHENSPLRNYVVEHAFLLKRKTKFSTAEIKRIRAILNDVEKVRKCAAHVLTHTLVVGVLSGVCTEEMFKAVRDQLLRSANSTEYSLHWPGNVTCTCYILINLIAVQAITSTKIFDDVIEKAYSYIVYALDHNVVTLPLPAGGEFKKPDIYTKAVTLRALVKYHSWKNDWKRIGVTEFDGENRRKRLFFLVGGIVVVLTFFAWVSNPALTYIATLQAYDVNGYPDRWGTFERFASVVGFLGFPGIFSLILLFFKFKYPRFLSFE